ncbi:MAG: winged helix-turn-helix domain-containing protein [Acidobacteriaceae bacterium]|nr:winged helix-turn-helix domain-containing protein [Acidobacteriaceae bacterium]
MANGIEDTRSGSREAYAFHPFLFYPLSGELHIRGRVIRCPVQSARTLSLLLRHAGEVVTREQLRAELWPENVALGSDDAINKAVSYLRDVLRDNSRSPKYIETLPKRGYRFVAPLTQGPEIAPAEVLSTQQSSPLELPTAASVAVSALVTPVLMPVRPEGVPVSGRSLPRISLLWLALVCLLFLCAAGVGWWHFHGGAGPQSDSAKNLRIGIAPFEAEGDNAEGLAESFRLDLTDALAQMPHLRVNAAHGTHVDADDRKAMLALQADVLLFGKLSVHQGHVTLELELARGKDATHLATFKYEVDQKQILMLREQAQKDLLDALKYSNAGEGPALGSTDNAEAYTTFLQAREHLRQWNNDSWTLAASEFRHTLEIDPHFARAYSGLAATLIAMAEHNSVGVDQNYQQARKMAQKALDLDPQIAEGYAELGSIAYHHDWDFAHAEEQYRRAIELDPAHSQYHVWLADLLCVEGHYEESIQEVNLAHALDPVWKSPYLAAMFIYSTAGQPERSLAVGTQLLERDPRASLTHLQIGWSYWYNGQYTQAVEEWRTMAELDKDSDRLEQEDMGMRALQSGGMKAYAELRLKVIESGKQWRTGHNDLVPSEWFVYAGQNDSAIAALNSQIERHDRAALQIAVDPAYAVLHHDPRYQMLVKRMGLTVPSPLGRHAWHSVWE